MAGWMTDWLTDWLDGKLSSLIVIISTVGTFLPNIALYFIITLNTQPSKVQASDSGKIMQLFN